MGSFDIAMISIFLMLSPVILAPCFSKFRNFTITFSFIITAAAALAAVSAGIIAVHHGPATSAVIQMGLPDLPFHLRLDPLAGFFLCVIGLLAFFVSRAHRRVSTRLLTVLVRSCGLVLIVLASLLATKLISGV